MIELYTNSSFVTFVTSFFLGLLPVNVVASKSSILGEARRGNALAVCQLSDEAKIIGRREDEEDEESGRACRASQRIKCQTIINWQSLVNMVSGCAGEGTRASGEHVR